MVIGVIITNPLDMARGQLAKELHHRVMEELFTHGMEQDGILMVVVAHRVVVAMAAVVGLMV